MVHSKETNAMKIAMLGQKRIPSREGGVEVVVEELATRMVKRGHDVCCYNRSGHHVSGDEFDCEVKGSYKGIQLKKVFTLDIKGLAAVTSSFCASLLAAIKKYDIVHVHAEGPAAFCWLPKLTRKKVVCTIHGLDHQRAKWGRFASWYIMTGEKNAVKYADEIIVLSKGVQDYFWDKYKRKTILIPNGVSKTEIVDSVEIKEKWGLDKDSYILFLGRIVPEKGLHYLLEAYKKIRTDKKLVIAGGSSDTGEYMESLKKMADDDVIFTGFQQGRILEELYSNAYIYVLPSDLEGMPLSLLEAMSYGNCCIVSDIAECADVVGEHGVIFKRACVEELEQQLQTLCNDKELVQKYKSNASEYICNKYNWDEVVEKTIEVYRGVIE